MDRSKQTRSKRDKQMRPPEGIDKIGVILHPLFLNKENAKKYFDPNNCLEIHPAGIYTVLSIKQEYFNIFFDYQKQIVCAIYELVKAGVINFPDTLLTLWYIYNYPQYFILRIVSLEFYSDWREEDIYINPDMYKCNLEEAKDEGFLYRYITDDKEITDTYYSNDKSLSKYDRSSFICYNKRKKDSKENQISHNDINNYARPIRTEFRLYADNTPWLHWDNLKEDYQQIFNRHVALMATIYNNFVRECISVNNKANPNFSKIIKEANKYNHIRYKGNKIKKRGDIKLYNDEQVNIINEFKDLSVENENIENAKKLQKNMEKLRKSGIETYENDEKAIGEN